MYFYNFFCLALIISPLARPVSLMTRRASSWWAAGRARGRITGESPGISLVASRWICPASTWRGTTVAVLSTSPTTGRSESQPTLSPQLERQRGGLSLVQFPRDTVLSLVDPYYTGSKLYAMTTYIMSLWSKRDLES